MFFFFWIKAEVAHTEATGSRSGTVKAGNVRLIPHHFEVHQLLLFQAIH